MANKADRWKKPGPFGNKPQDFMISHRGNAKTPINLKTGELDLVWAETGWMNNKITQQPEHAYPSLKELENVKKQNAELQVSCEILLNLLTKSELKKAEISSRLADLKQELVTLADRAETLRNQS